MNKKILGLFVILSAIGLGISWMLSFEGKQITIKNPPWQVNAENAFVTDVFGVQVGGYSLLEVVESLKKVPELAAFVNPDNSQFIEAYFSRVGKLQASYVAEVDVENVDLSAYARFDEQGKPMPSGKRKYVLSKTGITSANTLRVWKMAYLPATDYSEALIEQFFGKPESKEAAAKNIEYWYYPAKGLVIAYDKEGREVFYYSARAEYEKLKRSLPKKMNEVKEVSVHE